MVLETRDGQALEDACWLRKDTDTHINMAELDAAIRGLKLAIAWEVKTIKLKTDSADVHKWLSDALSGRAKLRTEEHGEMLIRRRVGNVQQQRPLAPNLSTGVKVDSAYRGKLTTYVFSVAPNGDSQ